MSKYLIILSLLLSSCTSLTSTPKEVKVMVSKPIVLPEISQPIWVLPNTSENLSIYEKVKNILVEVELHKYYEEQLLAVVKSCQ